MNMFAPALWTRWWDTLDKLFHPQDQPQPPNPLTWTWNCGTCDLAYFPTDKSIVPHLLAWMGRRTIAKRKSARQTERMQGVVTWVRSNRNVQWPKSSFMPSSHLRRRPSIITIKITRPKPAYGRQGLAGSWGQDRDEVSTFLVFLTSHFAPAALSSDINQSGTIKTIKTNMELIKPIWNHETPWKPISNHEKPTWNLEKL